MRLSSAEAYRLWAPVYDSNTNPLLALESRLLSECLSDFAPQTVLDIGCGTGRSMRRWFNDTTNVFGADLSLEMLSRATQKAASRGRVVQSEASALPFATAMADVTICSFAISYFPDVIGACSEMSRVTKRSGSVLISDLHAQAVANGWSRSFRVGGASYQIEHANYSQRELDNFLSKAGLHKRKEINAEFSEQEKPLFFHAGKGHLFEHAARVTAVSLGVYSKR